MPRALGPAGPAESPLGPASNFAACLAEGTRRPAPNILLLPTRDVNSGTSENHHFLHALANLQPISNTTSLSHHNFISPNNSHFSDLAATYTRASIPPGTFNSSTTTPHSGFDETMDYSRESEEKQAQQGQQGMRLHGEASPIPSNRLPAAARGLTSSNWRLPAAAGGPGSTLQMASPAAANPSADTSRSLFPAPAPVTERVFGPQFPSPYGHFWKNMTNEKQLRGISGGFHGPSVLGNTGPNMAGSGFEAGGNGFSGVHMGSGNFGMGFSPASNFVNTEALPGGGFMGRDVVAAPGGNNNNMERGMALSPYQSFGSGEKALSHTGGFDMGMGMGNQPHGPPYNQPPATRQQPDETFAYCFDRGNGEFTRLIPADMLPPLRDIPAIQGGSAGMMVLPMPMGLGPDGRSSNFEMVSLRDEQAASSASNSGQTDIQFGANRRRNNQSHIDCIVASAPSHNPKRTKIYCDKWVHEGVCAFTQQGCKYKHEMPFDKATQHSLGLFHGLPAWWKKHQAELGRQQRLVDENANKPLVVAPPTQVGRGGVAIKQGHDGRGEVRRFSHGGLHATQAAPRRGDFGTPSARRDTAPPPPSMLHPQPDAMPRSPQMGSPDAARGGFGQWRRFVEESSPVTHLSTPGPFGPIARPSTTAHASTWANPRPAATTAGPSSAPADKNNQFSLLRHLGEIEEEGDEEEEEVADKAEPEARY
ncbi:hypothetical protein B0T25DRAFT_515523 [Lasiosphaeria hispida]|uniref:C3H1-type domain-containing protein n=1 Tax=Lasiosphaeria hispida TaxID=260671 RepID=A0AAJ0HS45_9PEZI|nr:hypothetical protein B0T25DRAFT_515523 [Lasiosphaeria hispida]